MKKALLCMVCFIACFPMVMTAQEGETNPVQSAPVFYRDYTVMVGGFGDIGNAVHNSRTTSKLMFDCYYRFIAPGIDSQFLRECLGAVWSFTTTWFSTMASHEFGHFFRANEVGATFWIEALGFPGPRGNILFSDNKTKEDELNFVTGGIEVNTLFAMGVQEDWYRHNGLYNDELFVTVFHKIVFPAYAFSVDAANPNNWRDDNQNEIALGDVASTARLVFERQGKAVVLPDGTVNPELVSYYSWTQWASLLTLLLDFNTYSEVSALFSGETNGKKAPWLFGDSTWGYSYGIFSSISQLGTDIYLHNYLALNKQSLLVYLRYGFPLKNYGMGITVRDITIANSLAMDVSAHLWTQEYCSFGGAIEGTIFINFTPNWALAVLGRWKSPGYMLGLPLCEGLSLMVGIRYTTTSE